jgi:microcystin-dependent protein
MLMRTRSAVSVGFTARSLLVAALLLAGGHSRLHAQRPNAWQINDNSTISGTLQYVSNLTPAQVSAAKSNGWHYSLLSRLESDTISPASQSMAFGDGTRRFYIFFDLDQSAHLTAQLLSSSNVTYTLPPLALDVLKYHLYEIIYDPGTSLATYRFDGRVIATWSGQLSGAQSNQVMWGATASSGSGVMDYHRAEFEIVGQGAVATYYAGFEGDPVTAPSPTNQGWTRLASALPGVESDRSPDNEFIHPSAATGSPSSLRPGRATLNAIINPNGWPAACWFQYGPTTTYGSVSPVTPLGDGTAFVAVSYPVTGLLRDVIYHFRVVASNSVGTVAGNDISFTVLNSPSVPSGPAGGGQPLDLRQPSLGLNYIICTNGYFPAAEDRFGQPFVGEVRLFAGNFAPAGWALCHGQFLPMAANTALAYVLGTAYGGDGVTNVALPDMRSRTVVATGSGPGLPQWWLGDHYGFAQRALLVAELPTHTHALPPPYALSGPTGGSQPRPNRQPSLALSCLICLAGYFPGSGQTTTLEPFLGQMPMFAGNYGGAGIPFASGQLLALLQNLALYSVLGTTYGGDGQTTFALPDLRGRTPLRFGQGPGLSAWSLGQTTGFEYVTISEAQMPAHQHAVPCVPPIEYTTGATGGGQSQPLMQPSLALQYLIAISGEVPSPSVQATNLMMGEIQLYAGTAIPSGWTPCQGQLLTVAAYPALFSVLSNHFGGDGITTFALPSLAGRIPVGSPNGQCGATYGAEQALLTVAEMPPHTHAVPAPDFDFWITAFGLSNLVAAFDFDYDGDGANNGLEWATGTNPTNTASLAPLAITAAGQEAKIKFTRNTNATDVIFVLQRTPDLGNSNAWVGFATNIAGAWSSPAIISEILSGNPVNVEVSDSLTNQPAANYRLQLIQP